MNTQSQAAPNPDVSLLVGLIEHLAGPEAQIPFGTIAHLARLYVICDQQMKERHWTAAYRTVMSLYRIERELQAKRAAPSQAPAGPPTRTPPPADPRPPSVPPPMTRPPSAPTPSVSPITPQELQDALVALTGFTPAGRPEIPLPMPLMAPPAKRPDG